MIKTFGKFFGAIALFLLSILTGITGFMIIEGYDLLEAFYMAVITISTVGFNEVKTLSDNGRTFTSFYILFNLAIFAYIISVLTSYFFEGKLREALKSMLVDRRINKLENHVIVCGFGRIGKEAWCDLI